jgi:hypothetical protein
MYNPREIFEETHYYRICEKEDYYHAECEYSEWLEKQNKQLLDALIELYQNYSDDKCLKCNSESCKKLHCCQLEDYRNLIISITGKKPEEHNV